MALELGDGLAGGEGGGEGVSVELGEFGFIVERFEVGGTSGHAEEDDAFDAGCVVGGIWGGLGGGFGEEGGEGEGSEAEAGLGEEGASVEVVGEHGGVSFWSRFR